MHDTYMLRTKYENCEYIYNVSKELPVHFNSYCSALTQFMSSGCCVAMELVADEAIKRWRKLLGKNVDGFCRGKCV